MSAARNLIAAFSEEHVERLTGVSKAQLRYWDTTNLYKPSYSNENRRALFSRIYSFKDIVALRVLSMLRNQYSVPLQHLRKVGERLSYLADDKWTGTRLWVLNKKVVWQEPGHAKPQEIVSKQYVMDVALKAVISAAEKDVAKFNKRNDSKIGLIEKRRFVNHNAPVISGTRIPITAIKNYHDAGYSVKEILKEYPDLKELDVTAALSFNSERAAA